MKKFFEIKFHDVSTYVINNSKRPFGECAIVLICMILLALSAISTDSRNKESTIVDTAELTTKELCLYSAKADVVEEKREVEKIHITLKENENYGTLNRLETECLSNKDVSKKELNEKQEDTTEEGEATSKEETISKEEATNRKAEDTSEEVITTNEEGKEIKEEVENASASSNELMLLAMQEQLDENNATSIDNNLAVVENAEELVETGDTPAEVSAIPTDVSATSVEAGDTLTEPIGNTSGISNEEFDALCRIVEAEAGCEDEQGKILVANVVLNRVANEAFPNTITEVIMASGQFSPVSNGSFQNAVASSETISAVNRALAGENASMGALYFKSESSTSDWSSKTLLFSYGNHNFYSQ